MKNIAILASYNGSLLEPILDSDLDVNVSLIITNNSNANVLSKAVNYDIEHYVVNEKMCINKDDFLINILESKQIDLIILSGYMKKIPLIVVNNFKIINSHPSLLPKYGGKNMYGRFVHEAVIKNNEKISGATIHYVSEHYDEGEIIIQETINLNNNETSETLEDKVKSLEKDLIVKALKKIL
jgi:phosphoribosylglycinamide formyltransferase-1